jgi:hypothetical protein
MPDFISYLLANTYSSVTPIVNTASAICSLNGQTVPCENFEWFLKPFMAIGAIAFIIWAAIIILMIVAMWKLYVKAGQPGWAAIIPIYNIIILLKIIGKPLWWIVLLFIPLVNIVVGFMMAHQTAKVFGKDIGCTIGLILLPFIFYPILAFGSAVYAAPTQPVSAI